jgi:hypothetical protein
MVLLAIYIAVVIAYWFTLRETWKRKDDGDAPSGWMLIIMFIPLVNAFVFLLGVVELTDSKKVKRRLLLLPIKKEMK